jgi:GNAT superfamily N-acetyltransferase
MEHPMVCTIRKASPEEAALVSTIARQAKAHWGYAPEQLEVWGKEFLAISSDYIRTHHVWVACLHAGPVGVSGVRLHNTEAELDHLWILPVYIGHGIGRQLFLYTATQVQEMGYPQIVFTSDPHADDFYRTLGAEKIGEHYSVLQQTTLTKFVFPAMSQAKASA